MLRFDTMKVDAHKTTDAAATAAAKSAAGQGVHRGNADRRSTADPLSEDRLELSGLVSDIARAGAAGAAQRAEHVKALAKLHRTGGYAPDTSALSRKLIDHALAAADNGNQGG